MNILLRGISYTGHWLYCRLPHYSSDTIPVPKYITFNFRKDHRIFHVLLVAKQKALYHLYYVDYGYISYPPCII